MTIEKKIKCLNIYEGEDNRKKKNLQVLEWGSRKGEQTVIQKFGLVCHSTVLLYTLVLLILYSKINVIHLFIFDFKKKFAFQIRAR